MTFNVTSNGAAISGATVTLTVNATGMGITNDSGIAVMSVNTTASGTITAIASMSGYKNGTMNLTSVVPIIVTPVPTLSPVSTPVPVVSNNSTSGVIFSVKKAYLPLATLLIGGLVGGAASLSWVSKIFEFISDGLKEVSSGKVNVEEITRRGNKPGDKKSVGLRLIEARVSRRIGERRHTRPGVFISLAESVVPR